MSVNGDPEPVPVQEAPAPMETARIALRLPPIFKENITLWIRITEAHFDGAGIIADRTKYGCLVAALDYETVSFVSDVTGPRTAGEQYEKLKTALLERLGESVERRPLTGLQVGDKKPSHLMRQMRELAGPQHTDSQIVKTLWMQSLPKHAQAILKSMPDPTLQQLATTADQLMEVYHNQEIYEVTKKATSTPEPNILKMAALEIKKYHRKLADLEHEIQQSKMCSRSQSRSTYKQARERVASQKIKILCYFHKKHGAKTFKCQKPCSFVKQAENENSPSQ
ncbi:uncharacterized protein LOC143922558 [Arctopsyche grandis]|uniref:uncharacterized protein LOC143922558 n=1 Tax=Arctopsyche grandis TaxID=121162 RepID=UPI00406D66E0